MDTKNNIEADFVKGIHEHRITIYTTCFLFRKIKKKSWGTSAGRSPISCSA